MTFQVAPFHTVSTKLLPPKKEFKKSVLELHNSELLKEIQLTLVHFIAFQQYYFSSFEDL